MVQGTDTIKKHIDSERDRLGENLREIEDRVRNAADLRAWYERNTGLALGAAVAGGFALGIAIGGSRSTRTTAAAPRNGNGAVPSGKSQFRELGVALDNTFAALIALAARKFEKFVADSVPGFREEFETVEQERGNPAAFPS